MDTLTIVNIKRFPLDLWRAVRLRAFERGIPVRAFVVEALAAHLQTTETETK